METLSKSAKVVVKEVRQKRALSQEEFARQLGVSVRTVARWEGGLSEPSTLAWEKLQNAFSADKGEL